MIDEHQLERRLRRGADELRATIVARSSPPPIAGLRRRPPVLRVAAVAVLVLGGVGVAAALAIRGTPQPAEPATSLPTADATATLCAEVAGAMARLEPIPTSGAAWEALAERVDRLERAPRAGVPDEVARRLERFALLAGLAAGRGIAGEQLTAAARAEEAVAVGDDLVAFLGGCPGDRAASSSEALDIEPNGGE